MQRAIFDVIGMTSVDGAVKVKQALRAVTGVKTVKVSVREGKAAIQFDAAATSASRLKAAVMEAGYAVGAENIPCRSCNCCDDSDGDAGQLITGGPQCF